MTDIDRAPGPTSVEPAVDFADRLILAVGARQPVGLLVTQRDASVRREALEEAQRWRETLEVFADDKTWEGSTGRDAIPVRVRDIARAALVAAPRDQADGG
jgi:hypothetical protein